MAEQTPWAILRCKWSDRAEEPRDDDFFARLFTPAGAGTRNMVEFFDLMSHGSIDVSGSQVLGWLVLPKAQGDYVGNAEPKPGQVTRQGLVDLARATATAAGVDLSPFYGVVVCMNVPTDLFGGGGRQAVCDPNSFRPSVLGQEMGHGYGLSHSRRAGSSDDYQDPWDVMSSWNSCHILRDADYTEIGPGLNAANMRGRGWLDESRVWVAPEPVYRDLVVDLRPLHRRDLPGLLAAQVGPYLAELRTTEGWDLAIPHAAVLVHSFADNQSYIHPGTSGNLDLMAGDVLELGAEVIPWASHTRIAVESLDASARIARLRVSYRPEQRPPRIDLVGGPIFGGVAVDGGGFVIVGGKVVPIPPRGPAIRILEALAGHQAVDGLRDTRARDLARHAAMSEIAQIAGAAMEEAHHLESPRAPVQEPPHERVAATADTPEPDPPRPDASKPKATRPKATRPKKGKS